MRRKLTLAIIGTALTVAILLLSPLSEALAPSYPLQPSDTEIADALDYLRDTQANDGSIGSFATSGWVVMAIAAAGEDPHDWNGGSATLVDYLKNNGSWVDRDTATDIERSILAIVAACEDPTDFGGDNYVSALEGLYDGTQIGYNNTVNDDFWGVIALIAAGEDSNSEIIQSSVQFIISNQLDDDGWSLSVKDFAFSSDVDNTAAAIMALVASGINPGHASITAGLDFIAGNQEENGGFSSGWDPANRDSTSWAIGAIRAVGQDPTSINWTTGGGNTSVDFLLSLQTVEGFFNYTSGVVKSSEWGTAYAVTALMGLPYPVVPDCPFPTTTPTPTPTPTSTTIILPTPSPTPTPTPTPTSTAEPTATTTDVGQPTPTTTSTVEPSQTSTIAATSTPMPEDTPTPSPEVHALTGQGQVSPAGGEVTTDDGRVSLEFPQGAVGSNSTVTIEPTSCTDTPNGFRLGDTCFSITVEAGGEEITGLEHYVRICVEYTQDEMDAAGGAPGQLRLAYYSEVTGEWVALETSLDTDLGVVCAEVNHFSRWAIIVLQPSALPPWWVLIVASSLLVASILVFILVIHRTRARQAEERVKGSSEKDIDWEEIE